MSSSSSHCVIVSLTTHSFTGVERVIIVLFRVIRDASITTHIGVNLANRVFTIKLHSLLEHLHHHKRVFTSSFENACLVGNLRGHHVGGCGVVWRYCLMFHHDTCTDVIKVIDKRINSVIPCLRAKGSA